MEKSGSSTRKPLKAGLNLSPPGPRWTPRPSRRFCRPASVVSGLLVAREGDGVWGQGRRCSLWHVTFDSELPPAGQGELLLPAAEAWGSQGAIAYLRLSPLPPPQPLRAPGQRTAYRQHANRFNLVSDPPRGSPARAAGAMDFIQE